MIRIGLAIVALITIMLTQCITIQHSFAAAAAASGGGAASAAAGGAAASQIQGKGNAAGAKIIGFDYHAGFGTNSHLANHFGSQIQGNGNAASQIQGRNNAGLGTPDSHPANQFGHNKGGNDGTPSGQGDTTSRGARQV